MSSDMYPSYMTEGGSVVAYAPASSANLSVGFDVLGAALAPVDGSLLGDRVQVKAADVPFALSSVGRYAHKLPDDPKKNILHDCWVAYGEALEKRGLKLKPLEMVLEKNLPVGSGLGSSACSVVAALEGLNAFHGAPLDEHDMLLLMGEMEGRISGSVHYDNVAPCYLGGMQLVLEEHGVISQGIPVFDRVVLGGLLPGDRGFDRCRPRHSAGPISPSGLPHLWPSPGCLCPRQLHRAGGIWRRAS